MSKTKDSPGQSNRTSIKEWSSDDQPREKLLSKGKAALTDAELLAIIIGSGNTEESAVALMQRLLRDYNEDLGQLSRLSVAEFQKYKGIGEAKAVSLVAMLEIGRRRASSKKIDKTTIHSSTDAYHVLGPQLRDLNHEEFWLIILNQSAKVIKTDKISSGGIAGTVADPKVIFKKVLDQYGVAIILVHNHPSGNLTPSQSDIALTKKIVSAGAILDIKVHDHLIIGGDSFYSFADEGLI
ncbi:MAG: DNA repair protein RadC [Bacteroidia bacterium]|nr:DNA repair protein RadC [Bacteroidia bacterium]